METQFGAILKDWRGKRRMSQLDLGLQANVSARHIAFLETGRSKPSRSMVIQLSEALTIPRTERNVLLNSAGYAPVYKKHNINDEDMKAVRSAVMWTLERHAPYPALALDRHWHVVMANNSARFFLGTLGIQEGDSMLKLAIESRILRESVENWPEVARYMYTRLRTESIHLGGDQILDEAANVLAKEAGDYEDNETLQVVVPTRYRVGDMTLSLISTIAQFGTAEDIALADLKIELMFPADEQTRTFMNSMMTQ